MPSGNQEYRKNPPRPARDGMCGWLRLKTTTKAASSEMLAECHIPSAAEGAAAACVSETITGTRIFLLSCSAMESTSKPSGGHMLQVLPMGRRYVGSCRSAVDEC